MSDNALETLRQEISREVRVSQLDLCTVWKTAQPFVQDLDDVLKKKHPVLANALELVIDALNSLCGTAQAAGRGPLHAATVQRIVFSDVQMYLDAIVAASGGGLGGSPHGRFWADYHTMTTGTVPGLNCNGQPIPYIDKNAPLQSPFFLILTSSNGFCGQDQMPPDGPYITDANYSVRLSNGSTISGTQIQNNLSSWLQNGYPQT